MKKKSGFFNFPMGLYGKVEVCELIGIYMLSIFGETYSINNVRLQRVDCLEVFETLVGHRQKKQGNISQKRSKIED